MTTSKFKISNKVLSVLLCVAMLLSYLPFSSLTAFAADGYVASVTDKDGNAVGSYKYFDDALTAAEASEGSTLKLLNEVPLTEEQTISSGKFTIDLNGKTLHNKSTEKASNNVFYIESGADVTIKDSASGGTVKSVGERDDAITNSGTLTVESGTVTGSGGIHNTGTLTFNGGTAEASYYDAISNYGTAYIYGGKLLCTGTNKGISNNSTGTLYVYNGEITGGSSAMYNTGAAYISGGKFTGNSYAALNLLGGSVEVSGGSFTGKDDANGTYLGTPNGEWTVALLGGTLTLKGGEFPNGFIVMGAAAKTFLAEGYEYQDKDNNALTVADDAKVISGYVKVATPPVATVTDKDGKVLGKYTALADAVTEAEASEGSTLKLLDKVTLPETQIITSGKFTIDLNGKTLLNETATTLWIESDADVIIKDSGEGGTVKSSGAISSAIINGGTLTIESGNVVSENQAVKSQGALTIKGGSFEGAKYSVYIEKGTTEIYGGEFNGAVWGFAPYTINGGDFTSTHIGINKEGGVLTVNSGKFNIEQILIYKGTVLLKGGEFTNGFTVNDSKMDSDAEQFAATLLAGGYYYKDADGKVITVANNATKIGGYAKVSEGASFATDADITLSQTEYTYNGGENKPGVTVKVGGKLLTENTHYTIAYANNIFAGTATVTVKGKGIYEGEGIRNFTIKKAESSVTGAPTPNILTYTGNEQALITEGTARNGTMVYSLDGITYSATVPVGTDAGDYTVYYKVLGDANHNDSAPETVTVTINKANIGKATITLSKNSFVYNGLSQKPGVTIKFGGVTLTEGVDYELRCFLAANARQEEGGKPVSFFGAPSDSINADSYYVFVEGKGNFESANSEPYTISPAPLTVKAKDKTITYGDTPTNNGVTYTGFVNGEDESVLSGTLDYDYTYTQYGNVGAFDITPKGLSSDNYIINFSKGTLTVLQKKIEISWSNLEFTHNGAAHKPTATTDDFVPNDDVALTVSGEQTNANKDGETYTAQVTITGAKAGNYVFADIGNITVKFTIAKATYDMSGAKWNDTAVFDYNGLEKTVTVTGLPTGVSVLQYRGNTATSVGNYTASVVFRYDENNYNTPTLPALSWSIVNNWNPTEYTVTELNGGGWINNDFVITAKDGYLISTDNKDTSEWSDTLTYSAETDSGKVTFYLRSKDNDEISLAKDINYKLDKTNPTGTVEFVGREPWQEFINAITFDLFFKEEVTVKATANDDLSGVASVEYYTTSESLTLEEVKDITRWTEMPEDGIGVTVEDAKQFVYYIRITDNAGNVIYRATNGAEYDTTLPAISGIENGETYYTTQVVTVEDKNLASVELDGETVTTDNGTLTLAGNVDATYTIKATDEAGNVTEYTVTMKTIAELTKSLDGITVDDVTSDDKETALQVIEDIDEQLANDDLTEDEKAALEETKTEAQDLLDKIDEVANADDTENTEKVKGVTADNVTPEDKSDLEKAKEDLEKTLDDYSDNLTEDEKKAIQTQIDRIDKAIATLENVEAVEDKIGFLPESITKNDEAAIKATQEAYNALSDYEKSLVDKDAKKALDNAKAALAELNKPADSNSPQTGDNSNLWLWVAILFISGGVGITLTVARGKRRMAK